MVSCLARHRGCPVDGVEIHGADARSTVADLEDFAIMRRELRRLISLWSPLWRLSSYSASWCLAIPPRAPKSGSLKCAAPGAPAAGGPTSSWAVERRDHPVGNRPTRQLSLQRVAIGAACFCASALLRFCASALLRFCASALLRFCASALLRFCALGCGLLAQGL
jgi:hypothetical protein